MSKRRKFYRETISHIYQRTVGCVNLFYCIDDFLVFYTIFSVCSRRAKVIVLELCLMFDHFHALIKTENIRKLSILIKDITSWYAKEYNNRLGRKGRLFQKNFGSAPKVDQKSIISAINYVGNNPVEKRLCQKAEEYRWGFLAFLKSEHPFSEKIVHKNASVHLRAALKEVKMMAEMNQPLKYAQLRRMMRRMKTNEINQLIDFIIITYWPFDVNELLSYYESFEVMSVAMSSNTGKDFDINEKHDRLSHTAFEEMIAYLEKKMKREKVTEVIMMSNEEKCKLADELIRNTSATPQHIRKFLQFVYPSNRFTDKLDNKELGR